LNLKKVKKRSFLLVILLVLLVNALALPAHGFKGEENNETTQEPENNEATQKPMEIEEEEIANTNIGERIIEKNVDQRSTTYHINIGSATLQSDINNVPGVSFSDNVLYITNTNAQNTYNITGSTSTRTIEIDRNAIANLVFDRLSITNTPNSPIRIFSIANTIITIRGNNTITRNNNITNNSLYRAGIYVDGRAHVTFNGTDNDTLNVTSMAYAGAGIGGSESTDVGTITIRGGTIRAQGGAVAAGIGAGGIFTQNVSGVAVNIHGGDVTALGGSSAAGIGSGLTTNILSSMITVTVNITGGTVSATGGSSDGGAGIGTGANTNSSRGVQNVSISISGGIISANGGQNGAGSGLHTGNTTNTRSNISISGGRITATKGTNAAVLDIGHTATTNLDLNVQITGGSVQARTGLVHNPTNGNNGAPDSVSLVTLKSNRPQVTFLAPSSRGRYPYSAIAHEDGNVYAYLTTFDSARTIQSTIVRQSVAASVEVPNTIISPQTPAEVTLHGEYIRDQDVASVTDVYFEWGRTTDYGNKVSVMNQINTTTLGRKDVSHTLSIPGAGGTYHYRLVIEMGDISVIGESRSFLLPNIMPSADVLGTGVASQATLQGIYHLNSHAFREGYFEISTNQTQWSILTNRTDPIRIIGASNVNQDTGRIIHHSSASPEITIDGLTPGVTYYYRMTIVSDGGTRRVSGNFTTYLPITVEYVDMNGNILQPSTTTELSPGEPFSASAPEISNYTNVGVIVDGGERDTSKSYYINPAVSQIHKIQFVYDNTSTMVSLSVPARLIFASFASEGGALSAPNYQITNHSSLPVDVTLERFEGDADSLDGLTLVQGTPNSNKQIQLHLVGIDNFRTLHNLPNGILDDGYMGRLAHKNQPNSSGEFTFAGNYRGRFGEQKQPRFEAVFKFSVELPDKLKS